MREKNSKGSRAPSFGHQLQNLINCSLYKGIPLTPIFDELSNPAAVISKGPLVMEWASPGVTWKRVPKLVRLVEN